MSKKKRVTVKEFQNRISHVEKSGPEPTGAGFFRIFHGSKIPDRIQPDEIRPVPALPKRKSKESHQKLPTNHDLSEPTKTEPIRQNHATHISSPNKTHIHILPKTHYKILPISILPTASRRTQSSLQCIAQRIAGLPVDCRIAQWIAGLQSDCNTSK
ncbi:unnamed protein product [Adineta ricciae]|uniref:Uncharacterized protein n=1 Tax=Adineta ricciae TaxID=249248 RepID=A0A815WZC1_ADIRI|nr:unnamed protein product [Adineta ricciae]